MSKYKMGDEVSIKGRISRIDNTPGILCKYRIDSDDDWIWCREEDLIDGQSKTYEDGLNDAWELARKVNAMSEDEFDKCFNFDWQCTTDFTYQEILAMVEAYEESKAIKVGDVVYADDEPDSFGVVTWKHNNGVYVMWDDGSCGDETNIEELHKTGRTVDISHLLEQIRGNE